MPTLTYSPPPYNTGNVIYGTGVLFTAAVNTAIPSDANLGVGTAWTGAGWAYVGALLDGVTLTYAPTTQDITIEEQPTPVGVAVSTATITVTANLSEETLANINLAWGNAGSIATTPAGAGQPGKQVLTLSTVFQNIAVGIVSTNINGYASVLQIPVCMSAGQVQTAYRRAAQQRVYPVTLNSVCPFSEVTWEFLTAPATS